ncbi:MAG: hypothetical protein A2X19_06580 [Bacteroidetes bacterium GWE2_39_28]|nr:MAG: hypothetical protein A2X19_06580 [Bacteroidetes bacterium GWE2_39_28]OFY14310.1 MAG: hypothetical protein A2X16_09625 [Bacteroidetes bacterium GWF2_39_10]OFZ09676.1 MAG: hypothetical protein A2465_00125 [Bacteroidetes bacterium RIFOXYC2_FULL_39_11]HCT94515.1 hypothetical protein [Rikenellaceae bacterium]
MASSTHIEGRVVRIARPVEVLFAVFTDLTNFTKNIPPEMAGKADLTTTPDTLVARAQGMELGVKIAERTPFSRIVYEQYGNSPFPFSFTINLDSPDPSHTDFQLVMDTELSGMFKMMLGGKLKEIVDRVTDQIEMALGAV